MSLDKLLFAGRRGARVPGTVSLLLSLVLFFGISFASKPPRLDPDVEALMDI